MGSEARLVEKEVHQGLERGCLGNSNSKIPSGMGMGASSHTWSDSATGSGSGTRAGT